MIECFPFVDLFPENIVTSGSSKVGLLTSDNDNDYEEQRRRNTNSGRGGNKMATLMMDTITSSEADSHQTSHFIGGDHNNV